MIGSWRAARAGCQIHPMAFRHPTAGFGPHGGRGPAFCCLPAHTQPSRTSFTQKYGSPEARFGHAPPVGKHTQHVLHSQTTPPDDGLPSRYLGIYRDSLQQFSLTHTLFHCQTGTESTSGRTPLTTCQNSQSQSRDRRLSPSDVSENVPRRIRRRRKADSVQ